MDATLDVLTLEEAKAAILNNAGDRNWDALATYVTGVSRYLDRKAGAIVLRTITDETIDGLGSWRIALRYHPVMSITSVVEYTNGTPVTLTEQTLGVTSTNGYTADLRQGHLYRGGDDDRGAWPSGRGNILATYTAGRYADTETVDERFKLAAGIILANLWRHERGMAVTPDGFSMGATYAMPYAAAALLADDLRPGFRSVTLA